MKRDVKIDLLRGIAATLMILGHSFLVYPVDISGVPWCEALSHWIYSFHMELFFFLSGMVYRRKKYYEFVKGKFLRIVIPYFVFGIITLLLKHFGGSLVHHSDSILDSIKGLFLWGGGYWFLYVLFAIFLIYPFIDRLSSTFKIALLGSLILIGSLFNLTDTFQLNRIIEHLPYFMLGHQMAVYQRKRKNHFLTDITHLIWGIFISLIVYVVFDTATLKISKIYALAFFRALSMIAALYFIISISVKYLKGAVWEKFTTFLTDCSKYSLQLYLFNGFILTFVRTILCNVLHISNPVILVSVIWVSNILITFVACKYIISKSKVLSLLTGVKYDKATVMC